MASRLSLHEEFCTLLQSKNVYYDPPESFKMNYPCVRYSPSEPYQKHANDKNYSKTNRYDGIIMDYDADSKIPDNLLEHFSMFRLGKPYRVNNLNHFPFTLYY